MTSSYWRSVHDLAQVDRPALHMPGHGNRLQGTAVEQAMTPELMRLDQSEIGGLDYLHEPEGPLLAAQRRAAALYGASRSWFLVNGATVGNLAAVQAVARPGGTLIALRRSHQSVHAAVMLAGLSACYLPAVPDAVGGGLFGLDLAALEAALDSTPHVVGVHVTSPDYYGYGLPLAEVAELCHQRGVPLIVDEAHGGHLEFLDDLPTGVRSGADLVVHSPHKALGALTQSAVLHLSGRLVDPDRVAEALVMLQSSSPSSLLTLSLDAVFEDLEADGRNVWRERREWADKARELLPETGPLPAGVIWADPCKLRVSLPSWAGTLGAVRRELLQAGTLRPEFHDDQTLVFTVVRGTTRNDLDLLCQAVAELREPDVSPSACPSLPAWPTSMPEQASDARTALQSERSTALLADAAGCVAARPLTPYPPGIPLVLPGERLTADLVRTVQSLVLAGVIVRGLEELDGELAVVVVREPDSPSTESQRV